MHDIIPISTGEGRRPCFFMKNNLYLLSSLITILEKAKEINNKPLIKEIYEFDKLILNFIKTSTRNEASKEFLTCLLRSTLHLSSIIFKEHKLENNKNRTNNKRILAELDSCELIFNGYSGTNEKEIKEIGKKIEMLRQVIETQDKPLN